MWSARSSAGCVAALVTALACSRSAAPPAPARVAAAVIPSSIDSTAPSSDLEAIGRAIGNRRIVLVGEDGHGVSQFSTWKARLVRYLHERKGFDVLAFESGFHECREAAARVGTDTPRAVLQRCLMVQLHHAELEPLFGYIARARQGPRPLEIAGTDFQNQSYATRTRPRWYARELQQVRFAGADRLATLDSQFIENTFKPADSLRAWVRANGATLEGLYDAAIAVTSGDVQWSLRGSSALIRRELLQGEALRRAERMPAAVYESRDEWMARSIERALDTGERRKVIVWLHNDHARYGAWDAGGVPVRATGQFLRSRFGTDVFSIGLLAGSGQFADNFRRVRAVAPADTGGLESVFVRAGHAVSWLDLSARRARSPGSWSTAEHRYSRGSTRMRMRPGDEFDALVFFAAVTPATYHR